MNQISVVIITFNEEKNIARCLQSVQKVADEIIVVDACSTDRTKEISMEYGVRFFERQWKGYGEQKNWANEQACFDYILSLDADEALSPELQTAILDIKLNGKHDGYKFNRLNIYCGKAIKHGSWYPDTKLRLWNKHRAVWNDVPVHETLMLQPGTKIRHVKGNIVHYSYENIAEHVARINKYSDLWAKQAVLTKKKTSFVVVIFVFPWRFLRDYFIKLGILDGYYGLIVNLLTSFESFLKYSKSFSQQAKK